MTFDPGPLLGSDALGDALEQLLAIVGPATSVPGWATVELDRAETEILSGLDVAGERLADPANDHILGARARVLAFRTGERIVLLEPATEGRLAAALARHGEGRVALYVLADPAALDRVRAAGFRMTTEADGPLGPQRLVLGGPRAGPFLIVVGPRGP